METRARYVLVGLLTVLSLFAAMGFILWLAKVETDRRYAQYDILFDTVAGLGQSSAVRYNGVDVGKVLTIALDRVEPALVRVRIEINASTPVRVDTIATLASQGVTGVSFVALEGGSADADRPQVVSPDDVPVITSKPSVVAGLMVDAPDMLTEAIALIKDVRTFITPDNRDSVASILANLDGASAHIADLTDRADTLMAKAETTLDQANGALTAAQGAFANADLVIRDDLPALMATARSVLASAASTVETVQGFTQNGLPQFTALATDARGLVANIGRVTERIGTDPGRFFLGDQTPDYRN